MKYWPYFILCLLLTSSVTTVGIAKEAHNNQKILQLTFSEPTITTNGEFVEIDMEGTNARLYHARQPVLPVYTTTMSLPFGTKILGISCETYDIVTEQLPLKINPAPDPIISNEHSKVLIQKMDKKIYHTDEFFPDSWISYHTGAGLNDKNEHKTFLTIRIYPVRYNSVIDTIICAKKISITIDYKETPLEEVLYDISQKAGLNYVILPELGKTPITALMKDVPAKKALEIILRAYHLSFAWTATAYGDQLQVRREILKHTSEEGK